MIIHFVKHYAEYTPGDSAGFEDATAERYISLGVAASAYEKAPLAPQQEAEAAKPVEETEQAKRRGRPPKKP